MSAKREPLLSERLWEIVKSLDGNVADWVIDDLSEIHEDIDNKERASAKDAELIQQLVDGAVYIYWTKPEAAKAKMNEVLKAAAAAGFKPSEQ